MHCSSCQSPFLLMLAVISPLIACYTVSTSPGSKRCHLSLHQSHWGMRFSGLTTESGEPSLSSHIETTSKLLAEATWATLKALHSCGAAKLCYQLASSKEQDRKPTCTFLCHRLFPIRSWLCRRHCSPDTKPPVQSHSGP